MDRGRISVIAYTAIMGEYDLPKGQPLSDVGFIRVQSVPFTGSDRMRARWAKLLGHRLFPGVQYLLWVDGSIQLNPCSLRSLVEEHLAEHDMAVMRHPSLDCIYEDPVLCLAAGKCTAEQVKAAHIHYESIGYPRKAGHTEHGMILRRVTPSIIALCEAWLEEMIRTGTERDQWHMAPIARDMGIAYKVIPDRFFTVHHHNKGHHALTAKRLLQSRKG